ncbi:TonB-dependent receptor plug domain-containing protein [Jejuia pallidilutea]|uniref:Probable tonB-dependent receptor yncD n=1 Tax=Jejuia pallidilutea TaxID=504487 RepID=A0A090W4V5_9FLAO|nr:Plug domain-containing protein [Jejuia pallidilutea]GAL67480.1 probable tonB-dependent receptor yncD precursor [Jejuia pallidilutea]GAL71278.1 probable tonB-dependent receptor yncD precursor [Jejuia pallidilutea]
MKKKQWLPFIIAVLVTQVYFCQTTNLNRIIDSENGILVSEVEITQLQNDSTFTSNTGFFKIKTSGLYTFNKEGYILKTLKLNPQNNYVVKLQKQPNALNEIVINASHLPMELKASTSSVSLVSSKAIERANTVNINEALNRVPGVFMQTGALNTNRITIRGVGSRNLFGTSKIRAYFKDIPLTNGSGETSLEDFELGALSRIEITKGLLLVLMAPALVALLGCFQKHPLLIVLVLKTKLLLALLGSLKTYHKLIMVMLPTVIN